MSSSGKKWGLLALRWGIALAGIGWVVSNLTLWDYATILDEQGRPARVRLAKPAPENAPQFVLDQLDPKTGQLRVVKRWQVFNQPEKKNQPLKIQTPAGERQVQLALLDLSDDLQRVRRIYVHEPGAGQYHWVRPADVQGGYQLRVPHPRIEAGLATMVRHSDRLLLWAAVLVFPVVFVITAVRWNALLRVLDIHLPQRRTFVLNMVGCFYNTFMPGSTGGDLLKAYYVSKQTPHPTRAVMSVLIDRIIGLLALVILGGVMAGYRYFTALAKDDPASLACRRVALGAAVVLAAALIGTFLLARSNLRRALGVDSLLARLPLQQHVQHIIQVGRLYRQRPWTVLRALIMTFPVHIIVVISALLAGQALHLSTLPAGYYFVAVPVIVLSGALPLSPQGAGVMEFFAIQLTKQYGVSVSQAFALTLSIRLVQILWNLTGGIFVLRGGYHAPTAQEQQEMEREEEAEVLVR